MSTNNGSQDEMSCKELVELVTEYLEEALPDSEKTRFHAHLENCPGCTDYVEQLRLTLRISGRLEEESVDAEARDQLLKAFRNWKKRKS